MEFLTPLLRFDRSAISGAGFASLALRAVALFSRFLLLFYLAKHFPVATVGIYGLMVASADLAVYLIGLEFASFSAREIIHRPREEWPWMLRDQAVLHLLAFLPTLALIVALRQMEIRFFGGYAYWLLAIILVEHASVEAYRILIAASRPLLATLMHFIRFAAWVFPVVAVMWALPAAARLETVWIGWICGALASLAVPALAFRDLDWRSLRGRPVDWRWLFRGLGVAVVLFVSYLFTRGVTSLDRVILKIAHGPGDVGIYHFFFAIANVLPFLIDAGVQIQHGPRLVRLCRSGSGQEFAQAFRAYAGNLAFIALACGIVLAAIIGPLLHMLGQDVYRQAIAVFWWLLGAMFVWSLSLVPQALLYVRERDRAILLSNGIHFGAFFIAAVVLARPFGALGLAFAQFLAAIVALTAKSMFALQGKTALARP